MPVEEITPQNYTSFRQADRAVMVLGASWCQACEGYSFVLDEAARGNPSIKFGHVQLDSAGRFPEIERDFQVEAIPHTIVIKEGKVVHEFKGNDSPELERSLAEYFATYTKPL